MIIASILTVFVCCFNNVLSMRIVGPKQERNCHKLNVVLFFANSDNSCAISRESSAVKCLGMNEVARVKHSIFTSHDNTHNVGVIQRNALDCAGLLRDGLTSLSHFCQNALGMKTAIVSVSSQEITQDIDEDEESHEEMLRRQVPSPEDFFRFDVIPTHDKKNHQLASTRSNVATAKNIITNPQQAEVFNIKVKRQVNEDHTGPGEIISIPLEKETNSNGIPWDMLNFLGQIKYSFFGKLFEDHAKTKLTEEENNIPPEIDIGDEDPGLFETVKSTLTSLQETPGEEFLMVVFGGHLTELNNRHSPLVQSVKHVMETTDPENTLIVLTGNCAGHKEVRSEEVVIAEETTVGESDHSGVVPIFAKGPKCGKLQECVELHEIPVVVKSILAESSPSFGEAIASVREKRSLFSGVPFKRKSENHACSNLVNDKFYSVIFYFFVSLLFIL